MAKVKTTAVVLDVFGTLIRKSGPQNKAFASLAAVVDPERFPSRRQLMTDSRTLVEIADALGQPHLARMLREELALEFAGFSLFHDVESVVRRLRALDLKLGVCSNLAADYGPIARRLLPPMDAYVFSYEVGAKKPEMGIYRAVCMALRCHPDEILFIGDSRRSDVQGPVAYGMRAELLDRSSEGLDDLVMRSI